MSLKFRLPCQLLHPPFFDDEEPGQAHPANPPTPSEVAGQESTDDLHIADIIKPLTRGIFDAEMEIRTTFLRQLTQSIRDTSELLENHLRQQKQLTELHSRIKTLTDRLMSPFRLIPLHVLQENIFEH